MVRTQKTVENRSADDQSSTYESPQTLYCKAKKRNAIHILGKIAHGYQSTKERMPQSTRNFSCSFFA